TSSAPPGSDRGRPDEDIPEAIAFAEPAGAVQVPVEVLPAQPAELPLWQRDLSWIDVVLEADDLLLELIYSIPGGGWLIRWVALAWEWVFGVLALMVGLAFLAAVPVANFLTLGYLLEVGGRIARTGRLRNGFVGMRQGARVGGVVLGTWLLLLPVRLVSSLAV